jgi:hypothetical protein
MTADKRSVATDALETLGTIISENEKRDAIHLAVEPVIAGERLWAGADIGISADGTAYRKGFKHIGIVDPFIGEDGVNAGQRFWLVIYPRKITSLRHVWTHPDLPEPGVEVAPKSDKEASEQWLRQYAATAYCPDYDALLRLACGEEVVLDDYYGASYKDGEYIYVRGQDAHGEIPPEFWTHVEIVTGKKIAQDERPEYFSCSC